jgi:hypothetical protein
MTVRELIAELESHEAELQVMVGTTRPPGLLDIDEVQQTAIDMEKESHLIVLKCHGPN